MTKKNREQIKKRKARELFTVDELMLHEEQKIFYARREDVLGLWSDMNRNGIFFGEDAYIIEKKELDQDEFYKQQTRNMRYTEYLQIIDDEEKYEPEVLLKVPIAQVSGSKKGAYFVIDREKVTESVETMQEADIMNK
ncbi:50S ribosomal protein L25 domain protein [Enterococcus faecalis 13-SD-W-01]|nr:50S ribosomal protein L25 domain protein [Enterococcus faecalis 13-SD-W-01]